jgi:hypothetical protein
MGRARGGQAELWAAGRFRPEEENSLSLFFKLFKAKFQRIFKSKFEFDQTTHLKNLNATA